MGDVVEAHRAGSQLHIGKHFDVPVKGHTLVVCKLLICQSVGYESQSFTHSQQSYLREGRAPLCRSLCVFCLCCVLRVLMSQGLSDTTAEWGCMGGGGGLKDGVPLGCLLCWPSPDAASPSSPPSSQPLHRFYSPSYPSCLCPFVRDNPA